MSEALSAAYHIERSIANRLGLFEYPCACNRCRGSRVQKVETVSRHHVRNGRDPYLIYPVMTVDGQSVRGPARDPHRAQEAHLACQAHGEAEPYRHLNEDEADGAFTWPDRTTIDIESMARDAFARMDDIHESVMNESDEAANDGDNLREEEELNDVDMENLLRQSTEKVFDGSQVNRLQCAIIIFSLCSLYSVPNTFVDALLTWLAGDVLPTSNCFPRTAYEVKSILMKWGLKHRQVHCCPDGHVLYEGDNENLTSCPTCNSPRYVEGSNKVPKRVVRYFDIVKHLLRMFRCPQLAKHMIWYNSNKSLDQKMRSVANSDQWKAIDEAYPDFASVLTNLRLGLVGDGIIPFKNNALKHSTFVLLITIYNLPPWLLTKKFFISLAVLIPGPKAPTAENIDVFLAPLVRDLLKLWEGVPAMNMSKPEGERKFTLRAILMWTVNDFPAYGLLSGQQVHGYKGCPLCGPETCSEYALLLGKMIYLGGRRYLPDNHRYRRARMAFNNQQEWQLPPERTTGEEVFRWGTQRSRFLADGGVENSNDDPVKLHGVKHCSIFFLLPYWKDLPVRHVLDVMHCEKNLSENILRTTMGDKDTPAVRADMQACGIRPHLHLQPRGPNRDQLHMPNASYVLSASDKAKVLRVLKKLRTPTNYVSALYNKISKGKLSGLKSHDFHVLLQQVLPLCYRRISNKTLAGTIIRLGRLFRKLCAKSVNRNDKDELQADCAETICMLEKEMPPSFFDIMSHMPNHLVEELFLCGPVHTRWMYPYERYFKTLKGHVRNLAKPEGSIAQGYEAEEALGFITEYMSEYNVTSRRVWDDKEEPTMVDEILEGKGKTKSLSEEMRSAMHEFILDNASHIEPYRRRYEVLWQERTNARNEYRRQHPHRSGRRGAPFPAGLEEIPSFAKWLAEEVDRAKDEGILVPEDVEDSSKLPLVQAKRYRSMYAYGYHFRVKSAERSITSTCDSGVAAVFRQPCRSGRRDQNIVNENLEYIGEIEDIIELDYGRHCVVLLVCDWIKANYRGRNATVKKDEWGFTMANFRARVPFGYESFAFPIHCHQVFFSDDEDEPGWKVVLRTEVRGRRIDIQSEEEESEMFAMGQDVDYEGLQVGAEGPQNVPHEHEGGRDVEWNEVFGEELEENVTMFDRDFGESSEDDN